MTFLSIFLVLKQKHASDNVIDTEAELVDAFAKGGEIVLGGDIDTSSGFEVAVGQKVILDLGTYTITGAPETAKEYAVIKNKGDLTIKGTGAIICNHNQEGSTAYAVNTIVNSGTLTINGGTIENKSTAAFQIGYAIDNNSTAGNAVVEITEGEINASGSNYYDGIRLFCNSETLENSVTVAGGKVSTIWMQNPSDGTAGKNTRDLKGSVSISDGTVNVLSLEPSKNFSASVAGGYVGSVSYFQESDGRNLTGFITGGTFDEDPSAYLANGYEAVQDGDNWIVGKHEPKLVEEESATCFKEGRKAHYQCETCGRVYSDETGSVEIDLKDYTISMVGHDFVDGVCSYGCGTTGEINVSTHQGMTQVEVSNTITEENKENAFHVGASMIAPEGVDEAVEKICEEYQNDKELAEDAKKALENKGIEVSEGETVEVVVVTYLETEVKDADFSALEKEDTPVVTVEINLYYDLVATTNKTDKNQLNANNSVTLSKRNKIENPESVTLNFCLPADLLDAEALKAAGKVLYLKHPKGNGVIRYHEATLIDGEEWDNIVFVNDHGFSEFTLMVGDKVPADLIPTTSGKGEAEKAPDKEEVKKDPIEVHIAEPITPPAAVAPAPTGDSANIVGLSLTMIACVAAIVLFARRRVNK